MSDESQVNAICSTEHLIKTEKVQMTKKQKREAKENMLLERALTVMSTPSTQSQEAEDDDMLFCRFIASELQSIIDAKLKRMVKWKI